MSIANELHWTTATKPMPGKSTEHSGAKKGKGAWDRKKTAKKTSNKGRRAGGKQEIKDQTVGDESDGPFAGSAPLFKKAAAMHWTTAEPRPCYPSEDPVDDHCNDNIAPPAPGGGDDMGPPSSEDYTDVGHPHTPMNQDDGPNYDSGYYQSHEDEDKGTPYGVLPGREDYQEGDDDPIPKETPDWMQHGYSGPGGGPVMEDPGAEHNPASPSQEEQDLDEQDRQNEILDEQDRREDLEEERSIKEEQDGGGMLEAPKGQEGQWPYKNTSLDGGGGGGEDGGYFDFDSEKQDDDEFFEMGEDPMETAPSKPPVEEPLVPDEEPAVDAPTTGPGTGKKGDFSEHVPRATFLTDDDPHQFWGQPDDHVQKALHDYLVPALQSGKPDVVEKAKDILMNGPKVGNYNKKDLKDTMSDPKFYEGKSRQKLMRQVEKEEGKPEGYLSAPTEEDRNRIRDQFEFGGEDRGPAV
jgi:hypothetical protein